MNLRELLEAGGADAALVEPIARYGELLLAANRKFNVTGAKSEEELAPHLLDSLTVVPYLHEPYVDIGSGGGLPAIVAAIVTGFAVTMIETTQKKARFLRETLETLGLRGAVVAERAEIAAHDETLRGKFASGTARAVALAPTVAELLLPFLETGGVAVLQRGTIDERERRALDDAVLMLGGSIESETQLDGERRIIVVRKDAATSIRFPRRIGIPEKRPLCY